MRFSTVIAKKRLRLFGHLARADPSQDHWRIIRTAINRPPADWRRRAGRPRRSWLRTIELDLRPHNLGLNQRGCVRRIVQSGVSLWRRLCSLMGELLDGDDNYTELLDFGRSMRSTECFFSSAKVFNHFEVIGWCCAVQRSKLRLAPAYAT